MDQITKVDGSKLAGVDLVDILRDFYGMSDVSMIRLKGWCDVSMLTTKPTGEKFIFKVFIDTFTETVEQIEGEISMINFLAKRGFVVPEIVPTLSGKLYGEAEFVDDVKGRHKKRFRLQTFIEGRILDRDIFPAISEQMGDLAGRVDVALADFSDPYFDKGDPNFIVHFSDEIDVPKLIPYLQDGKRRQLALQAVQLYDEKVGSKIDQFPKQQIHCDMHSFNLIVDEAVTKILGLIDFSDSRNSLRVIEAAVSLVSILMFSKEPIKCCDLFLQAYTKHVALKKVEKEALRALVTGRMVQAQVMHNYMKVTMVGYNASYIDNIYGSGWDIVEKLLDSKSEEYVFFENFGAN